MADEIALLLEMEKAPDYPTGISECLDWGFGHVDNQEAVSKLLVREILPKCRPLQLAFSMQPGQRWSKTGHAQGGFIRREDIQSSPAGTPSRCTVFPVSAKHNLRQVSSYHPIAAKLKIPSAEVELDWGDLDWLPAPADPIDLRAGVGLSMRVLVGSSRN
jgi:hypothetical protein